jgi:hypothetical protein
VIMKETTAADIALLHRFEPTICFTRGERFFPMDVDRYVKECSLWVQPPDEPAEVLVPEGELTIEKMIEPRQHGFGSVYFLKFIEPLDILELARYQFNEALKSFGMRDSQESFRAGRGRLARVGYGSRFVDALFSLTLYFRGRVPGDTAAAAALTYKRLQEQDERYCYYGRVVRENGWVVLQYWYFYPFNNWRSGFFGVNDHEGDWEMVSIYCSHAESETEIAGSANCRLKPQWVAYASHDFSGDDLRRRWDDPELEIYRDGEGGEHPVVYAGAGSHASYYTAGEYLAVLELPFLSPLVRLVNALQNFWANILMQAGASGNKSEFNVFKVPFVDYARGDGLRIGPQQEHTWEARLLDDSTQWANEYRGLWGLYARDPISGENAPAGPVYNRDGSVRRSWYDPLGWAGLDKVAAPDEALDILEERRREMHASLSSLQREIQSKSKELSGLGIERAAIDGVSHLEHVYEQYDQRIQTLSEELKDLRNQYTVEVAKLEAFDEHAQRLRQGYRGPMRAHIHRAHIPSSKVDLRMSGLAESFSAVSVGLVMVGIVLLIVFAREYLIFGLSAMIGLLIFLEASFRRRLSQLISSLVIGLAIVSAIILLFEFFWQVVVVSILAAGVFIMWENIREIRR